MIGVVIMEAVSYTHLISVVLYYPFFKMYDKELLEEEKAKEAIEG